MESDTFEIKDFKFAKDLSKSQMDRILSISKFREFAVKEIVFEEFETLDTLYVLIEGTVVLGINVQKKGRINIGSIHPGSIFAWSALFPPYLSSASATAHTPAKVLAVPAGKLLEIFDDDPAFGYLFMKMISNTISQRLTDTRLQLVNIITI
jgi:CRP/FNR family transcriptional activator FtrB